MLPLANLLIVVASGARGKDPAERVLVGVVGHQRDDLISIFGVHTARAVAICSWTIEIVIPGRTSLARTWGWRSRVAYLVVAVAKLGSSIC
jgi:hypothetical protein